MYMYMELNTQIAEIFTPRFKTLQFLYEKTFCCHTLSTVLVTRAALVVTQNFFLKI